MKHAEEVRLYASVPRLEGAHPKGWDSRYPVTGFTREVNVADIPESVTLLNEALRSTLLPAAAAEFAAFSASDLRVNEALVVK